MEQATHIQSGNTANIFFTGPLFGKFSTYVGSVLSCLKILTIMIVVVHARGPLLDLEKDLCYEGSSPRSSKGFYPHKIIPRTAGCIVAESQISMTHQGAEND